MKKNTYICPFCGRDHLTEESASSCFIDPLLNYNTGDLLIDTIEGNLFRIAKLDKRKKDVCSDDVEVERFVWQNGGWVFGAKGCVPSSFWCRVRRCTVDQMQRKVDSTKKLLDLEELLLQHLKSS